VYDQIALKITDDHIVDIGCGCGLLATYLIYTGKVKTADLYDPRDPQITYAQDLVIHLGLQDKIKIHRKYAVPQDVKNSTVIATRLGSLIDFEKFCITNKLITVRRTKEVEPYMIRPMTLPWNIEIIKRDDGFELELLTIDVFNQFVKVIEGERWMETINPFIEELGKAVDHAEIEEVMAIGGDTIKLKPRNNF
jgi:hypothetical protein